jgi:hypothetical protein
MNTIRTQKQRGQSTPVHRTLPELLFNKVQCVPAVSLELPHCAISKRTQKQSLRIVEFTCFDKFKKLKIKNKT